MFIYVTTWQGKTSPRGGVCVHMCIRTCMRVCVCARVWVTDRIDTVVNCTLIHVKIKSKLTNLMKISRIEGYNGKYRSNPQGIREISHDLLNFDQIGQQINGRN